MSAGRLVASTVAAAVVAGGITAAPAAAETTTWFNTAPITFSATSPSGGSAYPSTIQVTGQEGPITDVDLHVNDIDNDDSYDLSLLLVAPSGETEVVKRGACAGAPISDVFWTFDQQASSTIGPDCGVSGTYRPRDACAGSCDLPGAPGPPYSSNFDNFNNENANGVWQLYAYDHCFSGCAASGQQIGAGWSLSIDTGPVNLDLPAGSASFGPASPYPSARTVSGAPGLITDLNVRLNGVFHTHPDDVEIMLEKLGGPKVMLMSDACGSFDVNAYGWLWDDEAPATMPNDGTTNICGTTSHRPTDHTPGENLPAPTPPGPYGTSLSAFDLVDPNGEWRLWVADDGANDEGFFTNQFTLEYTTRPRAATAFTAAIATVHEGRTAGLTVRRSGASSYAAASVHISSSPGSAGAGDFAPISRTLSFAPGQTERTVEAEAVADAQTEGAETFTVALSAPGGDAALAAPATTTVTIPARDAAAPETSIDKAPKQRSQRRKARVRFSSSEPGSSFECRLDKRRFKSCGSPAKLRRLKPGRHRFSVRAIDPAGNADRTPAKARWRVTG